MSSIHSELYDLILAYEDLGEADRKRADLHLSECGGCQLELERLQELGDRARDPLKISKFGIENTPDLQGEAATAEGESRVRLQKRMKMRRRTVRQRRRRAAILVPLTAAAAVILTLVGPWSSSSGPSILGLSIVEVAGNARSTRSSETNSTPETWSDGDNFALSFELEKASHLVVFHIDTDGAVSLVVPASSSERAPLLEGGRRHQVPDPNSDETWILGEGHGTESFLVSTANSSDVDLAALQNRVEAETSHLNDRSSILDALRALLEDELGPTALSELNHGP
jgi:hypothetical protein